MNSKYLIFSFILFLFSIFLYSQEFCLQPNKYIYKRGEDITVKFVIGENLEFDNWDGDSSRINNLTFYFDSVKDDDLVKFFEEKGDSLQVKVYDEGTCMAVYNSKNAYINLDSADFNAYLADQGLADALEYRILHNETDSSGRELYQRSVKTIFQVGAIKNDTYKQSTPLPLDIIPLSHPYKMDNNGRLSVLILFKSEPLVNTKIKVWHRYNNKTEIKEFISDEKGMINFPIISKGKWMISCVKMERLENDPDAQWQSYWGTCNWGYF